ncbi:hypothetical protein IAE60_12465 [Pseudoxanthomonas mexicana]|uniref:Uncharacterized protein n=1 Tax=Pseudoxanthomonas mexicana TaxID=128785 RepID=A0A7G9T9H9_PSEMX|nr:hypothetical protein [Pseudoxanthomonas mexicana]QNN76754.1 hypothetical protein IAE60_12465 [Pseudoxanthomonas mexicana]
MHTHQQAGLRIATCGLLVLAFAASAEDGIATGAAQAPVLVLESPVPELPVVAVSELGHAVAVDRLSALRGGDGSQTENLINVDGSVDDNTAHHITSGTNSIADGAFSNASGINTVIQNSGSNVLIQNAMIVTVDFAGGPQ